MNPFSGFQMYFDMMEAVSPVVYIGIVVFMLVVALFIFIVIKRKREDSKISDQSVEDVEADDEIVETEVQTKKRGRHGKKDINLPKVAEKIKLGTGMSLCMCFCPGNKLEFTTIPKPIGEIYQFDPSCPISGLGYIVQKKTNGEIVEYDPRQIEIVTEETPEAAWDAVHWKEDVQGFWTALTEWWKSPASWFAAGAFLAAIIFGLVVYD